MTAMRVRKGVKRKITCERVKTLWPKVYEKSGGCCTECHESFPDDLLEYESIEGRPVEVCCDVGFALEAAGVVQL